MSKRLLSPIWICVFTVLAISSCKSFKEPEFSGIGNVRVGEIGINGSKLKLDLFFFNPNKSKLQLKYAEGEAWMDENRLGHFMVDTLILIQGNSSFILPVSLNVDMNSLLQNAISAFITKEVMIKIEGKAKVGKSGLFINYPIHYLGKQNISELLKFQK